MGNKEMTKEKKVRDSKFEILRIISMLLIIAHHLAIHGFGLDSAQYSCSKIIMEILSLGGKLGVNLFILTSAYFMIDKEFKIKKLIRIAGETSFYTIFFLILFNTCLNPVGEIRSYQITESILPITYSSYWFVTDYILLMIFSPYLNQLINKFDKKSLKRLTLILIVMSVFISGTIPRALTEMRGGMIWFIVLYLTVGYIKKYVNLQKNSPKINLLVGIISCMLLILGCVFLNVFGHMMNDNRSILTYTIYLRNQNSILVFVSSIELFLFCTKLPEIKCRAINVISSTTLGVYLIHDNVFFKQYLWNRIFKIRGHYNDMYILIYSIGVIITIYVFCIIIDLLRQMTIEKLYLKISNRLYDKLAKKIKKRFNLKRIINKFI